MKQHNFEIKSVFGIDIKLFGEKWHMVSDGVINESPLTQADAHAFLIAMGTICGGLLFGKFVDIKA